MADQPYWDPAAKDADCTLSNSDRTASLSGTGSVRSTNSVSSGKWYVLATCDAGGGVSNWQVGFVNGSHSVTSSIGSSANGWAKLGGTLKAHNSVTASYGTSVANGDVVMLAFDADSDKCWVGENGTWYSSGDPAAGTGEMYSGLTGAIYLAFGASSGTRTLTLLELSNASYNTYPAPSGFTKGWGGSTATTYDQSLSATVSATPSIRKTVTKTLATTSTLTAALARLVVFPLHLVASATLSASIRKEVAKGLSASLTGTAAIRRTISKALSATLGTTAFLARAFPVRLVATISASASIRKTVSKTLSASTSLTASMQRVKTAFVHLTASASMTASLTTIRLFYRTLSASLTATASIRRTISKRLVATQSMIARPIAWVATQLAAIRNDKPNWNQCPRCARKVRPNKMHQQMEYRGPRLVWTGLYVCHSCLDEPQQQGIWPRETGGDPKPVILARPRRD